MSCYLTVTPHTWIVNVTCSKYKYHFLLLFCNTHYWITSTINWQLFVLAKHIHETPYLKYFNMSKIISEKRNYWILSILLQNCSYNKKMTVFWAVALCGLVKVYWCFRSAYCLHHQCNQSPCWWPWLHPCMHGCTSLYYVLYVRIK
jgi:hypothetical protein